MVINSNKIVEVKKTFYKHADYPRYLFASKEEMQEILDRLEKKEARMHKT